MNAFLKFVFHSDTPEHKGSNGHKLIEKRTLVSLAGSLTHNNEVA